MKRTILSLLVIATCVLSSLAFTNKMQGSRVCVAPVNASNSCVDVDCTTLITNGTITTTQNVECYTPVSGAITTDAQCEQFDCDIEADIVSETLN